MTTAMDRYADRVTGAVLARMRRPQTRKNTRHWRDRPKSGQVDGIETADLPWTAEAKALDPDYIVPASLIEEFDAALRPAAERVAADAVTDVADRVVVGGSSRGMFEVDQALLADLIDEALEDLLGSAERYAEDLRRTITEGDDAGLPYDDLVDAVEEAARRGGNWLRLNARTVGTGLAGHGMIEQARALGVTHTQWLSRRDDQVRPEHVVADGQVRPIGEPFRVGGFELRFPGDPSGLPATVSQIRNCRCGLVFADPEDDFFAALIEIAESARADTARIDAAERLLDEAATSTVLADGAGLPGLPDVGFAVSVPADVVGWRVLSAALDVLPGQQVTLPSGTVLALAAPLELAPDTLAVLIPEGTLVTVSGDTLTLTAPAVVQVLAAGGGGVQGRLA